MSTCNPLHAVFADRPVGETAEFRRQWPAFSIATLWALLLTLTLSISVLAPARAADEPVSAEQIAAMHDHLAKISGDLDRQRYSEESLRTWSAEIQALRAAAERCVTTTQEQISSVEEDLKLLGPASDTDSKESKRQRQDLSGNQERLNQHMADCRVIELRADELSQKVDQLLREQITRRLLAKSPTLWQLTLQSWHEPGSFKETFSALVNAQTGLELLDRDAFVELALSIAVALALAWYLRRRLRRKLHHVDDASFSSGFAMAARSVASHYLPYFAAALAIAWYVSDLTAHLDHVPLIARIAYGLPVLVVLIAGIRLFLAPFAPAEPIHGLPTNAARALARRFTVLLVLAAVGYVLFSTLFAQAVPQHLLLLTRDFYFAIVVLNLIWIVWIVGRIPTLRSTLALRTLLTVILIAAVIAEWSGYDNLSIAVVRGVTGTLAALGAALLLSRLLRDMFDNLDTGKHAWQRGVHRVLGLETGERVPGLRWFSALVVLLLWTGFSIVALRFWGMSEAGLKRIGLWLSDGFAIGSATIVPAKIALGLLGLAVLLTFSGWVRKRLEKNWLPRTRLDRGAREAIVAIVGYSSIALAVVAALVVAGFDFSNIAIIAGALSVGIGFGLQNIVNNFVSGLILLFERPIKTGDWVVVGGTEGHVKRISIRSTQIQTFDRADVIVPNSELISNQVTNWMLYDPRGRVRVPIGVAYGSDTALVKETLLQIAAEHPSVIKDKSSPEPMVIFLGFGESSLDFELRCFIENIDSRYAVVSDMNFAIDAAFRRNNIEIPFPQRDVHVRDIPRDPHQNQ